MMTVNVFQICSILNEHFVLAMNSLQARTIQTFPSYVKKKNRI